MISLTANDVCLGLADAALEKIRAADRDEALLHDLGLTEVRDQERKLVDDEIVRACCAYEYEALRAGAIPTGASRWNWLGSSAGWSSARRRWMTLHYSWAIPCEQALAALAARAPIVEVGAGGGYWAMLLAERGARIASFDRTPAPYANDQVARSWHPVARGGPERALRMHPERMLMLCWPPFWNSMAERALALHRGEWVAYIGEGGEGDDGCTATDAFHEALERRYALVEVVKIPQWPSVRDELELWRAR